MITLIVITLILAGLCLISDMLTGTAFWQATTTKENTK